MINKSMTCLQSRKKILLIFGMTTVASLVSASSQMQMVSASVEGSAPGANTSNSNQGAAEGCSPMDPRCGPQDQPNSSGASNPNQEAADHINEAKSALQNGDTEGAQRHLDLAHQALGCGDYDPRCASE
ncbi:MAG: hypothetical protein ACREAS_02225 [Nitrososphaera sp.]